MQKLLPWFVAFDHYHVWWLSVHLYGMKTLTLSNPEAYKNFVKNENFTISRTLSPYSSTDIDQCHEQLKKLLGGAIGITEDEDSTGGRFLDQR